MELWNHQKKAIEEAFGRQGYALFLSMGTGKTRTTIEILRNHYNGNKRVLRTLIFTPPMVVPQFREEWFKFSKIERSKVVALQGSGAKRLATFNKQQASIFITNYESLLMKDLFQAFKNWEPEVVVFDESHRLKSTESKRSKLAFELANPVKKQKPYTYILTGTPILNSPLDIFQQFKIMLGGFPARSHFVDNFYHFRGLYFKDRNAGMPKGNYFPKWEPKTLKRDGFDALSEIQTIISEHGMRVKKEECLDLPEELSVTHKVGMSKDQFKAYTELKKDLVTYIADKSCVASLAIVKALRLMQIVSGFISVGDGANEERESKFFEGTPKEEALEELLTELTPHSKVLIWAVWKANYETIRKVCERLGIEYVQAHGAISQSDKEAAIKRFTLDSNCKVFIGHPGSMGVGVNLVMAPYSIFYSRTFSLEHYLQARSRNHRGGQTQKVTHYDLVCHNTIDELVVEKLSNKIEIGESLLGEFTKELAKQADSEYGL